jgi:hypothetical protein
MAAICDSEDYVMPVDEKGKPIFTASLSVMHDWKKEGSPPKTSEISINVPAYFSGITLDGKEFEYDSCGCLYIPLNLLIDDFIESYDYGYDTTEEARFLRDSLQAMIDKLDAFIKKEEAVVNS